MGLFLKKIHLLRWLELSFSSKLDWGSYIVSIAKTAFKKIGAFICSMKFLSAKVALYLAWTTVLVSGLVPLAATWMLDKLQKWYVSLLVLHVMSF